MILTCPQCESRFNLSVEILAPNGKNVRCAVCKEAWFEKPDPFELAELETAMEDNTRQPLEDIPEGVKPLPENSNVPALSNPKDGETGKSAKSGKSKIGGFAAAALVFVAIAGLLISMKNSLVQSYPPTYALYDTLGMHAKIPGAGLIFDRLSIKEDQGTLTIDGYIINLSSEPQTVPMIEATLRDDQQKTLETWLITPPKSQADKEETIAFSASHTPKSDKTFNDINLRFVLIKR